MNDKIYYNIKDISTILGICYYKALSFVKYSGLPHNKIGNAYLINKNEFFEFMEKNREINLKEAEYNACIGTRKKKNIEK